MLDTQTLARPMAWDWGQGGELHGQGRLEIGVKAENCMGRGDRQTLVRPTARDRGRGSDQHGQDFVACHAKAG